MKNLVFTMAGVGITPLIIAITIIGMMTLTGCPEAQQMMAPVVEPEETIPVTTVAKMKEEPEVIVEPETQEVKPETEPATTDITPPADTTPPIPPPTIVEVGFYRDEILTQSIGVADTVSQGDTVHTRIVFSERMQYIVANDASARPALFFLIDDVETQYRMKRGGATHIRSGAMKPLRGDVGGYIGKVTIPEDSIGTFALRISGETTSAGGINIAETVIIAPFVIVERLPEPPIVEVEPEPFVEPVVALPEMITPAPTTPANPDSTYSYTLGGEVYPGYNPSPTLQHILDTHPSARLPYFEEAVKKIEVINWVYRKVWTVYPEWRTNPQDVNAMVAARDSVLGMFGTTQGTGTILSTRYFSTEAHLLPAHSKYWIIVEYLRLAMENPGAGRVDLINLFSSSKHNVVGITNPND